MIFYHIVILALIQGLTEFLPVSSSGHLVMAHHFMNAETTPEIMWKQNLMMDVAVHVGTLASVLLYFRKDVLHMLCGLKTCLSGDCENGNAKLALHVLTGSLPVIIAGLCLYLLAPSWIRSPYVIAWTTLIFGLLLWWVDSKKPADQELSAMTLKQAVMIGLSQALALIPGTSRSGITMTAARWYGFSRTLFASSLDHRHQRRRRVERLPPP